MAKDIEIVKKGYVKDHFTLEQIEELKKCMDDPLYFIENYCTIQHPTKGRVPFKVYDYQKEMIMCYHNNNRSILLSIS